MILGRGLRPTVARIRAPLGGGSPNDLAPALKSWKESFQPAAYSGEPRSDTRQRIPAQIADLAHETWQRASIAAVIERKGSAAARALAMRTDEAQSLKAQVTRLREQAALATSRRRSPRTTSPSSKPAKARQKKSARIIKTVRKKTKRIARVAAKKRRPSRRKR